MAGKRSRWLGAVQSQLARQDSPSAWLDPHGEALRAGNAAQALLAASVHLLAWGKTPLGGIGGLRLERSTALFGAVGISGRGWGGWCKRSSRPHTLPNGPREESGVSFGATPFPPQESPRMPRKTPETPRSSTSGTRKLRCSAMASSPICCLARFACRADGAQLCARSPATLRHPLFEAHPGGHFHPAALSAAVPAAAASTRCAPKTRRQRRAARAGRRKCCRKPLPCARSSRGAPPP